MLGRDRYKVRILNGLNRNPVVALLGPRQCGKTTLAHMVGDARGAKFFDLEDARTAARFESPMLELERLEGLVIIDEIQRRPAILEALRVLTDRPDSPARFLLLGSASPRLVKGASESLAGRVAFVDLSGFDLSETGTDCLGKLWSRGGLPRSFLAESDAASFAWRDDYVRTFLERDVPQLGITVPADTLRRFWTMVAHYHGQTWNAAEFARSLGASEATARRYLDVLSGAYVVQQLQPWFENISKRQVKSPKVYVRDSGLLHALLTLEDEDSVREHPKLGASWEGFVIEQLLAEIGRRNVYFWATHSGAELDLLVMRNGKRYGFEIKRVDVPKVTRSLRVACGDLNLERAYVVYPGNERYDLDTGIEALPAAQIQCWREE
jgi:predicted AAA+ superfamily ATPase